MTIHIICLPATGAASDGCLFGSIMKNGNDHENATAMQVALSGMFALAVAMGIGRFAFTPLLPMMLRDRAVDLNEGGWLATSNYLGYFIGAVLCACWRGLHPTRTIRAGLTATIVLTAGMGLFHTPALWLPLRLLSGIASALVFVYSSGWCLQRLAQLQRPAWGGIIYCGPGLGIVLTGIAGGGMVSAGWHASAGWLACALLAAVLTLVVWHTFSRDKAPQPQPQQLVTAEVRAEEPARIRQEVRWQVFAYGMAGFGYIITATFLPVIARRALPESPWPDMFWPLFGLCVALGALGATRIPAHADQRLLLSACYVMQAIGVIISAAFPSEAGFASGSILLGLPFTAISLFAMREAGRLRKQHAAGLMGLMTASYGIGQIAGPPLATRLVQQCETFTLSLSIAAAALLTGAGVYCWLAWRFRTISV